MAVTEGVQFLMNKVNPDGSMIADSGRDLEKDFEGLRYIEAKGLLNKGKRKNIYTETYSDSDVLRVWQGDEVTREATTIKLSLCFVGDNRQKSFSDFYDYVKNGKIMYVDTKRLRKVLIVLTDKVELSEEMWKGGIPYFKAEFTFQNLWGDSKPHSW